MKKIILYIMLLGSVSAFSQGTFEELNKGKNKGWFQHFEIIGRYGGILAHHEEMMDLTSNPFQALEVRIGWQTFGEDDFHQKLNFPTYGIGAYSSFFHTEEIGNPSAIFGFIDFPAWRGKNDSRFNTTLGVGLSYEFNNYDPIDNPQNIAIGSLVNLYFSLGFNYQWNIGETWAIKPGLNFSHFSNSSTIQPNLGLNMLDLSLGVQYRFNPAKKRMPDSDITINPEYIESIPDPIWKRHHYYVRVAGGIRQSGNQDNNYFDGSFFGAALATVNYAYQAGHSYRIGGGIDYMYDGSTSPKYWTSKGLEAPKNANSTIGVNVSNTLIIGKLELDLQVGYYLWIQYDYPLGIYLRPGFKYRLTDDFFAMVSFKTEYIGQAQYIEWGVGIDIF